MSTEPQETLEQRIDKLIIVPPDFNPDPELVKLYEKIISRFLISPGLGKAVKESAARQD